MKSLIIEDRREKLISFLNGLREPVEDIKPVRKYFLQAVLGREILSEAESLLAEAGEALAKADPEKVNALYSNWIEPGTITVRTVNLPAKKDYLLLSDKTDCGDLSIYSFSAVDEEEAVNVLQKAVFDSANRSEGTIQVEFNGLEGYILYKDEEKEFFRVIEAKTVPNILTHSAFSA